MNDRSPRLRVHDLGPLEVSVGDSREPIRGRRPTAILTLLAIHANHPVPVDSLVDALWGDEPSAGASSTLDSHVFRLRKQLEPSRATGAAPSVLLKQDDAFRLVVAADELDSSTFATRLDEAGAAAAAGRFDECLRLCDEALALWRGTLGGVAAEAEWAQAWRAGMAELRAQLHERRLDALIRSGRPERALPAFDALIRETPYREHLHALRMEACTGAGAPTTRWPPTSRCVGACVTSWVSPPVRSSGVCSGRSSTTTSHSAPASPPPRPHRRSTCPRP